MIRQTLAVILLATAPVAAVAQTAGEPATASDGRFQLERSGDGFIRLERQTGLTSYCEQSGGELSCRASADERRALQEEIDRLAARVDELEGRPAAERTEKDGDRTVTLRLPSDQEVNNVLGFFQDAFESFVDMIRGIVGPREGA